MDEVCLGCSHNAEAFEFSNFSKSVAKTYGDKGARETAGDRTLPKFNSTKRCSPDFRNNLKKKLLNSFVLLCVSKAVVVFAQMFTGIPPLQPSSLIQSISAA